MLYLSMDLTDELLVESLRQRDGPRPARYAPHSAAGVCRYAELYPGSTCPWCEAEARRNEREAAAAEQVGRSEA